ncbi:MAG: hypothetical protein AVO38_05320 [delta proteobacterium ML8_D]|jgi:hypothetical protein|nr:MAG: hypothetical protein AVO38_05320 [delta proteobacterium ML8_D]
MRTVAGFIMITAMIFSCMAFGCAMNSTVGSVRDEEGVLEERVHLFWKAKTSGDWDEAKTFVDPDLKQELTPYFERLKSKRSNAEYKSVNVKEISIEGENAVVVVDVAVKLIHPMLLSLPVQQSQIEEYWIRKKDTWYVVMRKPDVSEFFERFGPKEERR